MFEKCGNPKNETNKFLMDLIIMVIGPRDRESNARGFFFSSTAKFKENIEKHCDRNMAGFPIFSLIFAVAQKKNIHKRMFVPLCG